MSQSGGSTRLQGTQVKAQNFTVNAGVGAIADPNAKIIIEGVKETLQTSHTEKSESVVWQSMSGNGVTEETLKLAQINAKTKFSAPGGIDVQLPAGDPLKEQVQSMSKQPGMEWLNDLSQRKDVNWNEVKLLKDSWQYEHEGLTQAGAIIVAIAVTIATADATGSAATSITGASQGAAYSATQAALSAAISQAAVTLANNKGDIGKTMQDMGKSDNIKSIITSAVTAGALQSVNPDWMQQLSKSGQFTDKAVINLTNAAVSATIKTAIQGGSYEDNLTASLKTAGIDTVAGWAASNIGQGYKYGSGELSELQGQYIAHKVAHALVGCASAAAKDSSCAAGAIGGAVGEAFAEMYGQSKYGTADGSTLTSVQQQEVLNMSKLVTAAVAGMTGKNAQAAVDAAQNAVLNNFLTPKQLMQIDSAVAGCKGEPACEIRIRDSARVLSAGQDIGLTAGKALCVIGICDSYKQKLDAISQAYDPVQLVLDVRASNPSWTDAQVAAKATQYLTEAQSSLDAATWRTVFGTLDAVSAVATAASVLRIGGQAVGTAVKQTDTGIAWGGGIQNQGLPWENYLAQQLPAESRLPANFKTFDFYDRVTETAISAKTLDTTTAAKLANPSQVYSSLRGNIDDVVRFETATLSGETLSSGMIQARELQVAIPQGATAAQWEQINRAILYGQSKGVSVKITTVKP